MKQIRKIGYRLQGCGDFQQALPKREQGDFDNLQWMSEADQKEAKKQYDNGWAYAEKRKK